VLNVLNRELGSDFDPAGFRHRAVYNQPERRIEMHLVAERDQLVRFPDGPEVSLDAGESIRTEISGKYDRAVVDELFACAGLVVDRWVEDEQGWLALVMGKRS
jgi:L-histidine N-alpha-methyltransferase